MELAYRDVRKAERSPQPADALEASPAGGRPPAAQRSNENAGVSPATQAEAAQAAGKGRALAQKRAHVAVEPLAAQEQNGAVKRRPEVAQQPNPAQPAWTQASDDTDDLMI